MAETSAIQAKRGEEFPRDFTRHVTDLGDWSQLEPLFDDLASQIRMIELPEHLRQWLRRQSELDAVIDEEYARRYIAMTCQTDDKEREAAYLHYVENILPKIKPWHDKIARLYLECPAREALDRDWLRVHDRALQNQVELYREENIPLQTEDQKLGNEYQKISGAMTVMWEGEEKTLQQMAVYTEDADRAVRERAWRLVAERRLADRDAINAVFAKLIDLRTRMARNAGFANFRDYQHRAYNRFDYTPEDCLTFHRAIEQEVVPRLAAQRRVRREKLKLERLRPWDLSVDVDGKAPLKPFSAAEDLAQRCGAIFADLGPTLAAQFQKMRDLGLLDLESRKGKAPGGYQYTLEEVRLPFIFMNAAGTHRDVETLLHEGGHAFHAFAARDQEILTYRSAPIEFCEVASMAMELFGMKHIERFYPDEGDARRARRRHLEQILSIFPWIATVDAFQHWIYLNPEHTVAEREAEWLRLEERFDPEIDWSGLDAELRNQWQRQLHIFLHPFYYVEYGIAQLGALQIWLKFRREPRKALEDYLNGLALGGSRPLPELFAAAGIRFDFSAATLAPVMQAIEEELASLN
ncbi:MAG TPA: M3 family oligoendopeptidase [Candidatus Sumerlaeota bacterium]|nr:MAG: Peptidase family M3 [candidate division BRC1 bacterium ADurb.BinA292]HOE96682.1 M3 family oligoendopeptidase [Candidatus Sumerlaeota bacterium]HOR28060.1 M3 family oligoendopeptidase [Candidatus Sumerlaeota bacterium]